MQVPKKHILWIVLFLFVSSLVTRATFLLFVAGVSRPLGGDEPEYHGIATSFMLGNGWQDPHGYKSARSPLTPLLLVATYGLTGIDARAARWSMVLVSALVAPVLFLVGLVLFGTQWRPALLASSAWVFYPPSIFYTSLILTENMAALLTVLGVAAFLWAARSHKLIFAACTGVSWGLAALNRPVFLFVPFIVLGIHSVLSSHTSWRWLRTQWFVGLLAFVATMTPWTIRNYQIHGVFMPTISYGGIMVSSSNATLQHPSVQAGMYYHNPQIRGYIQSQPEALWNSIGLKLALDHIRKNMRLLPKAVLNRVKNFWTPKADPYDASWTHNDWIMSMIWVPTLILFVASFRWLSWRQDWPGLAMILCAFVFTLPFWGAPRFRFPIDPLIILRAVVSLDALLMWCQKRLRWRIDIHHRLDHG